MPAYIKVTEKTVFIEGTQPSLLRTELKKMLKRSAFS